MPSIEDNGDRARSHDSERQSQDVLKLNAQQLARSATIRFCRNYWTQRVCDKNFSEARIRPVRREQLGVKGTKKSRVHARPLRELPRFENSRDVEMPAGFVQPER